MGSVPIFLAMSLLLSLLLGGNSPKPCSVTHFKRCQYRYRSVETGHKGPSSFVLTYKFYGMKSHRKLAAPLHGWCPSYAMADLGLAHTPLPKGPDSFVSTYKIFEM